jgi:hypothetical protein
MGKSQKLLGTPIEHQNKPKPLIVLSRKGGCECWVERGCECWVERGCEGPPFLGSPPPPGVEDEFLRRRLFFRFFDAFLLFFVTGAILIS